MITALTVGIDALSITLVLALAAFGLAIIFGLIGVINLGHGAMLTLGAYFTWATTSARAAVPPWPRGARRRRYRTGARALRDPPFLRPARSRRLLTWGFS